MQIRRLIWALPKYYCFTFSSLKTIIPLIVSACFSLLFLIPTWYWVFVQRLMYKRTKTFRSCLHRITANTALSDYSLMWMYNSLGLTCRKPFLRCLYVYKHFRMCWFIVIVIACSVGYTFDRWLQFFSLARLLLMKPKWIGLFRIPWEYLTSAIQSSLDQNKMSHHFKS